MIKGIGCDIIDVSRMERAMEKERFLEKVFTPNERELIKNGGSAQSAAGMWAAKEAVSKAFGTGFSGVSPKDLNKNLLFYVTRITIVLYVFYLLGAQNARDRAETKMTKQ